MRASLALKVLAGLAGLVAAAGCDSNEPGGPASEYQVGIYVDGDGGGRITTMGGGALSIDLVYNAGSLIGEIEGSQDEGGQFTLVSEASTGSKFAGWYGAGCSGTGTCQALIDDHRAVLGVFHSTDEPEEPFTIRLVSPGEFYGEGRVTSQPGLTPTLDCTFEENGTIEGACQASYPAGTDITLTVAPKSGSTFREWLTPGCGAATTCTVTLTRGLRTVYVLFEPVLIRSLSRSASARS